MTLYMMSSIQSKAATLAQGSHTYVIGFGSHFYCTVISIIVTIIIIIIIILMDISVCHVLLCNYQVLLIHGLHSLLCGWQI